MNRQIEVHEFHAPPVFVAPRRSKTPSVSTRNWSGILGLIGTLILHGMALQGALFGKSGHQSKPIPQSAGALQATPAPVEDIVLVTLEGGRRPDTDLLAQIALMAPDREGADLSDPIPEALPTLQWVDIDGDSNSEKAVAAATGDPSERALMVGRYTSQINARIERAWVRPRTAVGDEPKESKANTPENHDTFRCRVQIRQDANGFVQEVLLLACNGTEAWRHSLVVAINQSSPLPSPPIPGVFTRKLTLSFEAHAYRPGNELEADQYEPVQVAQSRTASPGSGLPRGGVRRDSVASHE